MPTLIEVRPSKGASLWLRYDDGCEGEVDLSDLVGKGVFEPLRDPSVFAKVRLGDQGQVVWTADLELCPDALYLRLTGKSVDQVFPGLRGAATGA